MLKLGVEILTYGCCKRMWLNILFLLYEGIKLSHPLLGSWTTCSVHPMGKTCIGEGRLVSVDLWIFKEKASKGLS